ncbi:hypothetical protein BH09PAT2_BH09PAT2_03160 [soil metagenome]
MLKISLELKLLIFLILIASVPLIILDLLWFSTSKSEAIRTASFEVEQINAQARIKIHKFFLSQSEQLRIYTKISALYPEDTDVTIELKAVLHSNPAVSELQLVDNKGIVLIDIFNDNFLKKNKLNVDIALIKRYINITKTEYISDIMVDTDGKPYIILAMPVVSKSSKSISAKILVEKIQLTEFLATLGQFKTTHLADLFIIDPEGKLITAFYNNQDAKKSIVTAADLKKLTQHFTKSTDVYQMTRDEGDSLMYYSNDPYAFWGIIAQIPLEGTLSTIRNLELFTIVLFLSTLAFVSTAGFFMVKNIVTPIQQLKFKTQSITAGQFNQQITIKSGDEIEDLANSFNSMSYKLKESFDKLDSTNKELYLQKETVASERNKLSLILSGISDGVIVTDRQRNIILFNMAAGKITGCTASMVMGKPLSEVFRLFDKKKEILPTEFCPIRSDDFEGVTYSMNELILESNRDQKTVVNLLSGHIAKGLQVGVGCILSLHDVTEKHNLEAMKLDFVSMAAHELRTPLTSIHGYLELFLEENKGKLNADQNLLLNSIGRAAVNLSNLVESLLNVTRIDRGVIVIKPTKMDWLAFIQNIMSDFFPRAMKKKITLGFTPPAEKIVFVYADQLRIQEVFTNLLNNALNYTHEGGTITVIVEQTTNAIVTSVTDTGIGIPSDAIPHLFGKFYRVSNEFSASQQGTGLGLYLCKSIMDMHKGDIGVRSEVGKGSTFYFSLPLGAPNDIITK